MNSFIFKTADLRAKGGFKGSLKAGGDVFPGVFSSGKLLGIESSFVISLGDESLLLEGEISARAEFECSRCLARFETVIEDSFEEIYENPQEEINIKPAIEEALAMMEPSKPVCPQNCDESFIEKYRAADPKENKEGPFSDLKKVNFKKKEK
ncbi:MAG: hypothetical protein Fur0012_14560 [Elusimicrobiota bacterium]